jgi:hypothetical protein
MELRSLTISCGAAEMHSVYSIQKQSDIVALTTFLNLYEDKLTRPIPFIIFSDADIYNNGIRLCNILNKYPSLGTCISTDPLFNPNSCNMIRLFHWSPSSLYAGNIMTAKIAFKHTSYDERKAVPWKYVWPGMVELPKTE